MGEENEGNQFNPHPCRKQLVGSSNVALCWKGLAYIEHRSLLFLTKIFHFPTILHQVLRNIVNW